MKVKITPTGESAQVMSDKEIVFQAINKYAKDLASNLFHFNSVASQAVITYVVKNMEDKYGNIHRCARQY